MASPNNTSNTSAAVAADKAMRQDDEYSTYTVFRKAAADILGAIGFGGIISGFGALITAATHGIAPDLFTGIASSVPSTMGLLMTAAIAGSIGTMAMLTSTAIRSGLECEKAHRDACGHSKDHAQVVVVPMQGVSVNQAVQQEAEISEEKKAAFVQMVEQQRQQAHVPTR